MGITSMVEDLHSSTFAATVGFSVYPLGFGVVPLFTSSLSEEFGRFPLYILTTFFFALAHVMTALQVVPQTFFGCRTNKSIEHPTYKQ